MTRARHRDIVVEDPKMQVGPFRIMRRTDQVLIAVDERLPLGRRTVAEGKTIVDICLATKTLWDKERGRTA